MATIEITRNHSKSVEELKKKIDEMAGTLDAKYAVRGRWEGDCMILQGSGLSRGVTGRIDVTSTQVRVEIDLPLLLRPMKGQVEGSIVRKLDRTLGGA